MVFRQYPLVDDLISKSLDRGVARYGGKWRNLPATIVILIGIALSFAAFLEHEDRHHRRQVAKFLDKAEERVENLQLAISAGLEALYSLRAFYSSTDEVTRLSFHSFAEAQLARHPEIQALSWNPDVPAGERANVERIARSEGFPKFRIVERNDHGELVTAANREHYLPVLYLEPYAGNEAALGFDIASDVDRRRAIALARDSGSEAITGRIRLVQETADQFGALVLLPVYQTGATVDTMEQRRRNFEGLIVGAYRISDIVEEFLLSPQAAGKSFDVYIFDQSAPPGEQRLYPSSAEVESVDQLDGDLLYSRSVAIAGRAWQIAVLSSMFDQTGDTRWPPKVGLVVGILFSILLGAYMRTLMAHRTRIEQTVGLRTQELNNANQALREREREMALQKAQANLERRVEHRTSALLESQDRYQTLVETAPVCIHEIDLDGKLISMNAAGLRMMGVKEENEIRGLDYFEIANTEFRQHIEELFAEALQGTVSEFEFEAGSDRESIYFDSCFVPIKDQDGRVTKIMGISQDITERKQTETTLRQAQKMEAIGQLTGGVAHDFNNLLAVILGNAEMLKEKQSPERREIDAIVKATLRGSELTQRLLAYSRRQALVPQIIDLGALVLGMSNMLTRTLGETIEISISAPPDLWAASADPGQVENVLLNLALNSRDAMPDGGKLTVECANDRLDETYVAQNPEVKTGDYVVLQVSDEGCGMTAEEQAHAFEPFFTTKDVGQGSGLGLSMIYGFAKQSGGHVNIYSEEGKGTTVKFYLPRARGTVPREAAVLGQDFPNGNGEMILVIEDNPEVRTLAVSMLESLDYRVIDVADAAEANAVLEGGTQVDLVLSDVILPGGVSGPEFADTVRKTHPDLNFVFMSGYTAETATRNGFLLGSDQVLLSKPFKRRELAQSIHEALG